MKNPFILHLALALVWLFLSGIATLGNFVVAMAATFILLALFQRAIGCQDYARRVRAFLTFSARFFAEIIRSNLRIMRIAALPGAGNARGCYVRYDVAGLTDFEVFLIAQCINMSPGTMAADREEPHHLIIHCFPAEPEAVIQEKIDATLKRGILSFTR